MEQDAGFARASLRLEVSKRQPTDLQDRMRRSGSHSSPGKIRSRLGRVTSSGFVSKLDNPLRAEYFLITSWWEYSQVNIDY